LLLTINGRTGAKLTEVNPYTIGQQLIGTKELDGKADNHLIQAMIETCHWDLDVHDETPWCSAFINFVHKLCNLPRSNSLAARSWLSVGTPIYLNDALPNGDVVILQRGLIGSGLGHVGFFSALKAPDGIVFILGGNQANQVNVSPFEIKDVVGVRRF
jgi:uncharacterized protein (TIGR02594 family)